MIGPLTWSSTSAFKYAFSVEFPVFRNIYDLAESSLGIGFHRGNCCLEILVMKQRSLL